MIHEEDKASIGAVSQALSDGDHPSIAANVSRLVELVYEKGRLRGHQESLQQIRVPRITDSEDAPHLMSKPAEGHVK